MIEMLNLEALALRRHKQTFPAWCRVRAVAVLELLIRGAAAACLRFRCWWIAQQTPVQWIDDEGYLCRSTTGAENLLLIGGSVVAALVLVALIFWLGGVFG